MDEELLESLRDGEGLRLRAYRDTRGIWTIGYGTNLQALTIDKELAERWLREKAAAALKAAGGYSWFFGLNRARQNVIVEMIYNLGPGKFNAFRDTHAALARGDYKEAAREMLDSDWADQVKGRATRLASIMETGEWHA